MGLEDHRADCSPVRGCSIEQSVAPNVFERQLEPAIAAELEAILSEGRSGDVSAESL